MNLTRENVETVTKAIKRYKKAHIKAEEANKELHEARVNLKTMASLSGDVQNGALLLSEALRFLGEYQLDNQDED